MSNIPKTVAALFFFGLVAMSFAQAPKPITVDKTFVFTATNVADTIEPFKGTLEVTDRRARRAIDQLNEGIFLQKKIAKAMTDYKATASTTVSPKEEEQILGRGMQSVMAQCAEHVRSMSEFYDAAANYRGIMAIIRKEYAKRPHASEKAGVEQKLTEANTWINEKEKYMATQDKSGICVSMAQEVAHQASSPQKKTLSLPQQK